MIFKEIFFKKVGIPLKNKKGILNKTFNLNKRENYFLKNEFEKDTINAVLVGNPNCGKSTLFNKLTGSSQHVGNWPGVTVEKKEGLINYNGTKINIIDLPGAYSLSPYSFEEIITRNYILENNVDVIINVVDATNLKRNLYLTTQLLEMQKPTIVVLNMIDLLKEKNVEINLKKLEELLGVPVLPICASKGTNLNALLTYIKDYKRLCKNLNLSNVYSKDVLTVLKEIKGVLHRAKVLNLKESIFWTAIKLFEDDAVLERKLNLDEDLALEINDLKNKIKLSENENRQVLIAGQRYSYLNKLCDYAVKTVNTTKAKLTDVLDNILLNKFLAFPLFLAILAFIFYVTFGPIGTFFRDIISSFICKDVGGLVYDVLNNLGASSLSKCLVKDGIIQGVGSVLSFLPQIAILFTLLSFLEDSGYMARAAFIMDGPLRLIGLSGKAFVPLLMGFGCSVPAVLGTRILEKNKDKIRTIFMIPFISCSAKTPIYAMFISIFFSEHRVLAVLFIYFIGVFISLITAIILKKFFKKEESVFVMELPDYKLPIFKNLFYHVWEKVKDFLEKAGTVLIASSIIIWFLQSFNFKFQMVKDSSSSILALIGAVLAPIFSLCGFSDWRASVSLLCGIIAKESVVSTMAILYGAGNSGDFQAAIVQSFTMASAFSFMVFALLYTPCIAALSAIKKELPSLKLFYFLILYQLIVALGVSALAHQVGRLIFGV